MSDLTKKQVMELFNVEARTLQRWQTDKDDPLPYEAGGKGKPNSYPLKAIFEWGIRRRLRNLNNAADGNVYDYQAERARLTKLQADHENLKVKEKAQDLIPADMVSEALTEVCTNIKTKMLSLPTKMAPKVAGSNQREVQALLEEQVREALTELYSEAIVGMTGTSPAV